MINSASIKYMQLQFDVADSSIKLSSNYHHLFPSNQIKFMGNIDFNFFFFFDRKGLFQILKPQGFETFGKYLHLCLPSVDQPIYFGANYFNTVRCISYTNASIVL